MPELQVAPYPDTMVKTVESAATPATSVWATGPGVVRELVMEEATTTLANSQPIMATTYPAASSGRTLSCSTADATAIATTADVLQATGRQLGQDPGSDSEAAVVERLFHLIADRFERKRGPSVIQSEYDTGDILPKYTPPGFSRA